MLGRDLPDHQEDCLMPHPPPHIWAHPHDWSLQLLYLHYFTMLHSEITLHIYRKEGGVALPPHRLRGPSPLSPARVLQQLSLVVTLAPVGLNAQGSGRQLWCQSPTTGRQK